MSHTVGAPLAARELPTLLRRVHAALEEHRDAIDDLNVFPVPDGDTGTNLTLTIRASLDALHTARREHRSRDPHELARAVIRGALRGARGNSGVIISQVVRAVVEEVVGHEQIDARLYARALRRAEALAYEAVADPVEGTILTALTAAADAADQAVADGADLHATSARTCTATAQAVEHTRDQLEVLRQAGVVDAGARGLEVLLAAVHAHLTGWMPTVAVDAPRAGSASADHGRNGATSLPYEVQYLLDAPEEAAATLRAALETLGESVVVVGAGGLLNVHVHTGEVGAAIDVGLAHGQPRDIEVVHLSTAVAERDAQRSRRADRATALATVAVISGDGAEQLAGELGAEVVRGSAGALPAVADLLEAIARTDAEVVVLLPGHPNAVATAMTAADLAGQEQARRIEVIEEADDPPSVLAGLAVCQLTAEPTQVLADVRTAAAAVRAGEVVAAVRDADTPVGPVRTGQPLAVAERRVVGVFDDDLAALGTVVRELRAAEAEVVTLLHGADRTGDQRAVAERLIATLAPEPELEVIDAGVRPAAWWVGVE
ncbi:MAG: DAK2 domain-containing protein [Nitriliruptoraceae bacterium]